jgi:hypothetical protein
MADEIRASVSLQVSKGGAAIATGTLSGTFTMAGTYMGTLTQAISTIEAMDLPADVSGDAHVVIKNMHGSAVVTISKDGSGTHVLSKLNPGEFCLLTRVPSGSLYAASTVTDTLIQTWVNQV